MAALIRTEILMNVSPQETRVAVMEDGVLQEVHFERPNLRGITGNIYLGKVVRVLPGMQAAFVDIGLERAGFLHVSDVMPLLEDENSELDLNAPEADVRRWLYEGQELLVQVLKDPLGTKGARLSTHLSIASRYLVYMPDLQHIGVSIRLEDEAERERLKAAVVEAIGPDEDAKGYIVRTVAEGVAADVLASESQFLRLLWASLQSKASETKAPAVVHEDLPLVKRALRDMVTDTVEKVRVDSEQTFHELLHFAEQFVPDAVNKLELYKGVMPIFDMYSVEEALQKALLRKVPLKSGGSLIIDQTEAMTTIDVNTGSYVGSQNLEDTIFKTNMEAAQAIGRQLRLRNLGGIIILDFIDMSNAEHREQVVATLSKVLARDHAKTMVSNVSELGLVQMTRKRTHESLAQQLCEACPNCQGRGKVKTVSTICYEIFREVVRESKMYEAAEGFMVVATDVVIDGLMEEESQNLGELEAFVGRPIKLQADPSMAREHYDIILL